MFRKQKLFYQKQETAYPIHDLGLSFSDYQSLCKKIITKQRLDLNNHPERIIEANAPFEFRPATTSQSKKRCGVLLIHGLLDSAFIMRDLGQALSAEGLLARSILLPGHGTTPGALMNVTYQDWIQALQYGIASFKKEVDQLFLVGFSIGGALASYQMTQEPSDFIAGAVLLAPAFQINSNFTFLSSPNHLPWERAQWLSICEEDDYVKYCSIPLNAVYQCAQLMKKIKACSPHHANTYPQLMISTLEDSTVLTKTTLEYFAHLTNTANRLLLYTPQPVSYPDPRITVRSSAYPSQKITGFSHIGIPVAPSNAHYGKTGDYSLASRIGTDEHIHYGETDVVKNTLQNLLYRYNLSDYHNQRLTFNPDFDFMRDEIIKFIKSHSL